MILDILTIPNSVLHTRCEDAVPGPDMSMLLHSMVETLQATSHGVGLAAPQVGVSVRAFVVGSEEQGYLAVLNPRITKRSGVRVSSTEQCLSVPGKTVVKKRPYSITVEGIDAEGNPCTFKCRALAAAVVCHEIDHLDGRTI